MKTVLIVTNWENKGLIFTNVLNYENKDFLLNISVMYIALENM